MLCTTDTNITLPSVTSAAGAYTGFPCLGVEWQKLENPDMRKALNMQVRTLHMSTRPAYRYIGSYLPTHLPSCLTLYSS